MNILPSIVFRSSPLRSDGGRKNQNPPEPHSSKRNAMAEALRLAVLKGGFEKFEHQVFMCEAITWIKGKM